MSPEQIIACFTNHAKASNIAIVEGNKGLYDGLALDGSNSNAALAHLLDLPVVLVIDARGMTRGIAPLILGYQAFDRNIRIAGVILNQVGGARHESKLRAVIEHYTDVPVLGAIAHDPRMALVERHLGLMPNHELDDAALRVRAMGELVAQQVDLARVQHVAQCTPTAAMPLRTDPVAQQILPLTNAPAARAGGSRIRIGVARDKAFGFYYPDDLQALESAGAVIVPVDTLRDARLPEVDGLFIGGGFPEMFMQELQANSAMRDSIHNAIEAGLPVYAECGGLMYLARSLRWQDRVYDMVGAIPADVVMHARPVGRGYVELQATGEAPWCANAGASATTVKGHEFHYSSLENLAPDLKFAYRVLRGHGVDGQRDGIVYRNVVASYAHLRSAAGSGWADAFVSFVRARKLARQPAVAAARTLTVNGRSVATDVEGYLKNIDDWTEDFARAQAEAENLQLTEAHWQVISFLRAYYEEHRVQAQVRAMIWHFAKAWGPEYGNNHHLHTLFPIGGPQKQGNRLAGLLKTKGEH
jgi:cobyrinic acid a,c-diamide synthase